jgi:hypothetical protein
MPKKKFKKARRQDLYLLKVLGILLFLLKYIINKLDFLPFIGPSLHIKVPE